jgi:hypothetical protein
MAYVRRWQWGFYGIIALCMGGFIAIAIDTNTVNPQWLTRIYIAVVIALLFMMFYAMGKQDQEQDHEFAESRKPPTLDQQVRELSGTVLVVDAQGKPYAKWDGKFLQPYTERSQ